MEPQRKTYAAKRLLRSHRVKGPTGTAEAFVLEVTSRPYSPQIPLCSVVNHTKLGFKGAQKFEDLTKSKNFCGTLLHKISFIVLAKKIFGVRCTLRTYKQIYLLSIFLEDFRGPRQVFFLKNVHSITGGNHGTLWAKSTNF